MKLQHLASIGLLSISTFSGLSSSIALAQSRFPSTTTIEKAKTKFRARLGSLKNSDLSSYVSDFRSPADKQARNNLVNSWRKVDPSVAPFLGRWHGYEMAWSIYPSKTRGQVCIMMGGFGWMDIEMGKIINDNIYTKTGGVVFKEGDYLGLAAPLAGGLYSDTPFRSPMTLTKPSINEEVEDRYKAIKAIKTYEKAGCTTSVPNQNISSSTLLASAQNAILKASDPNSRINLRFSPSTTSRKLGYGLVGDGVTILERSRGSHGYTWYKVQFPRSRAIGWIRGDFVTPVRKRQINRNSNIIP